MTTTITPGNILRSLTGGSGLSGLTQGSVVHGAADGTAAEDNANFFYDSTNKEFGVGTASPGGTIEANQSSGTGAKPALVLRQSDVSEPVLTIYGTSAPGVLTQSLVAEGDVTSAVRVGLVKVQIEDAGGQITGTGYIAILNVS